MDELIINLGERRDVTVRISARDGGAFEISDPTYILTRGDTVVDEGVPELAEHDMTVTVEPAVAGVYVLALRFGVAGEIIIRKAILAVRG